MALVRYNNDDTFHTTVISRGDEFRVTCCCIYLYFLYLYPFPAIGRASIKSSIFGKKKIKKRNATYLFGVDFSLVSRYDHCRTRTGCRRIRASFPIVISGCSRVVGQVQKPS